MVNEGLAYGVRYVGSAEPFAAFAWDKDANAYLELAREQYAAEKDDRVDDFKFELVRFIPYVGWEVVE